MTSSRLSIAPIAGAMLIAISSLSAAPQPSDRTFLGVVSDSECPDGDHSHMRMADTDAACALACVETHDGSFVLAEGEKSYELSDQKAAKQYAGRMVRVTGTLDGSGRKIQVTSIAPR